MAKNDLMERKRVYTQTVLDIGVDVGFQQAMDYVSMCLHDPDVVGSDTWGPERQARLIQAVQDRDKHYAPAFGKGPEADVYRDHMDRELRDCWREKLQAFEQRYPMINKINYGRKK